MMVDVRNSRSTVPEEGRRTRRSMQWREYNPRERQGGGGAVVGVPPRRKMRVDMARIESVEVEESQMYICRPPKML